MIRIFLVGYMGAGKTTLGKALARRMNISYIDTDHFIENRYCKKVGEIFTSKGEEYFREVEHRVLCEVADFENIIISTGGGLPCFNNNMDIMNDKGKTVFLDVSVEELAIRLKTSKTVRPVLKDSAENDLADFIKESLDKRRPFYEQAKLHFKAEQMYTERDIEVLAEKLEALVSDM